VTGVLDDATVTGYRVCVRPMPADGQSIVGWLPGAPGVYVAVTHSGVTLGAHLAALITSELLSADEPGGPGRGGTRALPAGPLHRRVLSAARPVIPVLPGRHTF
jgi:hypothetical protein